MSYPLLLLYIRKNKLTYTINNTTSSLTVPYASNADAVDGVHFYGNIRNSLTNCFFFQYSKEIKIPSSSCYIKLTQDIGYGGYISFGAFGQNAPYSLNVFFFHGFTYSTDQYIV